MYIDIDAYMSIHRVPVQHFPCTCIYVYIYCNFVQYTMDAQRDEEIDEWKREPESPSHHVRILRGLNGRRRNVALEIKDADP